jgi:methionine synthase II (cobalamin-independent)
MPDDGLRILQAGAMNGAGVPREGAGSDTGAEGVSSRFRRGETPWRPGIATGIGSMPGTDPVDSAALIAGELPDLPHLVELPDRGAGADMIGRTAAMLIDMPVEVVPSGWRLTARPGRDLRRATDFLAWDVDAAERHFAGAAWVKVQLTGPWTLAAQIETPRGHRAVHDPGAVADLASSLAEGLAAHLAELSRRLPGTGLVVQVDEPSLPGVLAGTLPTASGFGSVPAVDEARAQEVLTGLTDSITRVRPDAPLVAHCCHPDVPIDLLRRCGFGALSLDPAAMGTTTARLDQLGEAIEAGIVLLAGLVPTREPTVPDAGTGGRPDRRADEQPDAGGSDRYDFHDVAAPLVDTWHRLGLAGSLLGHVVVTPACGLAGAPARWARRALALSRDAASLLAERAQQG